MIRLLGLLGLTSGTPWLFATVGAIGFLAGLYTGVKLESSATWKARAETAEVLQDVAERSAKDAEAARKDAEARATSAAAIAAATAREAKEMAVEVRRLREVHRDITTIFREEPRDPTCDCSLSDATRRKLLDIRIRSPPPKPSPPPAAPAGRGGASMPGSGRGP